MSADTPEGSGWRQNLLDEVRRRAGVRRQRRHRLIAGAAVLTVVAVVALAVQLSTLPGGNKVQVVSPPGGSTSSNAQSAPTSVAAPTTVSPVPPESVVTASPTPPPTTAAAAAVSVSARLLIVICPTTFGIVPPPVAASVPASMTVTVPGSLATQVAVYTDNQGIMKLVGPRGWACQAGYGADGSGGVAVYPTGQSLPSSWTAGWQLPASSSDKAIVGLQTSACQGCATGQACPLFTSAARDFTNDLGRVCPQVRPPAESGHQISAGVVGFQDPPGVVGDGVPSGGAYPANGVMTYYSGDQQGSWLVDVHPGRQRDAAVHHVPQLLRRVVRARVTGVFIGPAAWLSGVRYFLAG